MAEAPVPDDEAARLEAVQTYRDDSEPVSQPLSKITETTATFFDAETVSVNIISERRQEFLICFGRDWPATSRDDSICTHTIVNRQSVMEVEDTRDDPRFLDNELLESEGIVSYLGAKIQTADGHAIGTLCVFDDEPRSFSAGEKEYLVTKADLVMDVLELNTATEE